MNIGGKFLGWFESYIGRWTNVWINLGLCILFTTVAVFIPTGWVRDLWWFVAGTSAGYTLMWLTHPRFSAARRREMEAEMKVIIAGTLNRMTGETLGHAMRVVKGEDEPDRRRLQ